MKIRVFQKGFNYSQDGPGNRLVYHLQGCNMRCPWCANPEGIRLTGIGLTDIGPTGAGSAADCEWDVRALLDEALRSRPMFFEGGGVTFTGGEPTLQFEALRALLTDLRRAGVDTALETNATHPRLPELFGQTDHLMMDFKQPFDGPHRAATGLGNAQILHNLRVACAEHADVLIRIPAVNGYNASPADMEAFARVLSEFARPPVRIELLAYHEYGRDKWRRLGLPYAVEDGFLTREQLRDFHDVLRRHGLNAVRT